MKRSAIAVLLALVACDSPTDPGEVRPVHAWATAPAAGGGRTYRLLSLDDREGWFYCIVSGEEYDRVEYREPFACDWQPGSGPPRD